MPRKYIICPDIIPKERLQPKPKGIGKGNFGKGTGVDYEVEKCALLKKGDCGYEHKQGRKGYEARGGLEDQEMILHAENFVYGRGAGKGRKGRTGWYGQLSNQDWRRNDRPRRRSPSRDRKRSPRGRSNDKKRRSRSRRRTSR